MFEPMTQKAGEATGDSSLQVLLDFLEDPVVLEVALLSLLAILFVWLFFSLRSSLRSLQGRRQLVDYLDGLEALLAGDPERARKRLTPVVEIDPENLGARLALGEALYELDNPAEAHRQHIEAHQVFQAESPSVHLSLSKDLRMAGEHGDALMHLDKAIEKRPRDEKLLQESWSLREEMGRYDEAFAAGQLLFSKEETEAHRRRLAQTAAKAGEHALGRGENREARDWFQKALHLDSENLAARRGSLMLEPRELEAAASYLPEAALLVGGDRHQASQLPASLENTLLSLFPEAECPRCGAARGIEKTGACPSCESMDLPVFPCDQGLLRFEDPEALLDEIEENRGWFERLARRCAAGEEEAREEIREASGKAILPLLVVYLAEPKGPGREALAQLLVELGNRHPGELLSARIWMKESRNKVLDFLTGVPNLDRELGTLFRRLGSEALPAFQDLLDHGVGLEDPGLRELVIDYFVGLGHLSSFERLAPRYSPVEIVRHLNRVPAQDLVPLIQEMPEGSSFLRDAILMDPNLDHDEALVEAFARCPEDVVNRLGALIEDLGPSRDLLTGMVGLLAREPSVALRARGILEAHVVKALKYIVAAYADPASQECALPHLEALLLDAGPLSVRELVRVFGASPSYSDDRCIHLIAQLPDEAIASIQEAYEQQVSLIGKLQSVLFRGRHPRRCLIRALEENSSPRALPALRSLVQAENDAELSSLLREALRKRREDPS